MTTADRDQTQTFSTPSPGEILRRQSRKAKPRRKAAGIPAGTTVAANAFKGGQRLDATRERGVVLAPIVVKWTYRVGDPALFAKWLRTKEILLSDARFNVRGETTGVHYFGTYLDADTQAKPDMKGIASETTWGFSGREALDHFFALGKGEVDRLSIVETDLKDFLTGLRGFVRECDPASFHQSVLVSPQAE